MFILYTVAAVSQVKHKPLAGKPVVAKKQSRQLKNFLQLATEANVIFTAPPEFKEMPVVNNDNFSFDYAMTLPGRDFEIWFQVRPIKHARDDLQQANNDDDNKPADSPDSLYSQIGSALADTFTGDQNHFTRIIPQDVLERYNATAGKTYILDLLNLPETKSYKYALLITLQKGRSGTIVAVCFANDKGAEFFKNINKAAKCLKFKP